MRRKATKNTRAANAAEKRFQSWTKERPCCLCGQPGPSICDHMYGSTYRHKKTLIGHWAVLAHCPMCDQVKTWGGRAKYNRQFGTTQAKLWLTESQFYPRSDEIPPGVLTAILDLHNK